MAPLTPLANLPGSYPEDEKPKRGALAGIGEWFKSARPVSTALQRAVDILAAIAKKWIGDKVKFDRGQGPGGLSK